MKTSSVILFLSTALAFATDPFDGFHQVFGPRFQPQANFKDISLPTKPSGTSAVRRWNRIAIDASGLDHTPVPPGESRTFGEQIGPCRASRAMAIVHIAMFDTINAVMDRYESYTGVRALIGPVSLDVAISQAAHDTLVQLFPSQKSAFDALLAEDLQREQNPITKLRGVWLGQRVAEKIMEMRTGDGSEIPEPQVGIEHLTSDLPGHWRQDPISQIPLALGAYWWKCKPFAMQSGAHFRAPPPPAMGNAAYALAYDEVKRLGGDGVTTPTERTPEQTHIGIYWAYDGTPSLCAPPRLYNQIALQIADQMGSSEIEVARLLALANVAMSEAALAVWDSKFHHDFWRPITGIRESDPETGPTGAGDGNDATIGDPAFSPLGAPASNLNGPNFTPPFPAYPSGHAGIGGALFQTLRRFYGTDNIAFTFVSDEFNGITRDNNGNVRPLVPRTFSNLSQAEEENGQSRIYLGIHWSFDKTEGIVQGRNVADYVFDNKFKPRDGRGR